MDGSVSGTSLPLSVALREGSRPEHEAAESSAFVADLVAGRAPAWRYAAYLHRLRAVYAALEPAVHEHREHPAVAAVHDADLARSEALEADLGHWSRSVSSHSDLQAPSAAPAPSTDPPSLTSSTSSGSPAAAAYCARIEAARQRPHLLVAHHYTRYLGDLSGGRVLADALRRGYVERGLERGGLAFYDFARIPKPVAYKRGYRDRLDAIDLTPVERAEVVAEVRATFRLNRAVFDEVAAVPEGDLVALRG